MATNINTLVMSNVPKKYDGMMIVDVDDAGRFGDYGYITDNYVAKTSTQIKSAIGNTASLTQQIPIFALAAKLKTLLPKVLNPQPTMLKIAYLSLYRAK